MQLLVAINDKTELYEISPIASGYSLKYQICQRSPSLNPERFTLTFSGKSLKDDVSLDIQGVTDGSLLTLHITGKGGVSKITALFWVAVILYGIILFSLMVTGFFSLFAYLYSFLLESSFAMLYKWMFDTWWVGMIAGMILSIGLALVIGVFFGNTFIASLVIGTVIGMVIGIAFYNGQEGCLRGPVSLFLATVNFIIKHTIVFLAIFVAMAVFNYPIFGVYYQNHCETIYISKMIALISALVYIVIFGLYNLPNLLFNPLRMVSNISKVGEVAVTPTLIAMQNTVNDIKYQPVYLISTTIQLVHNIMSSMVDSIFYDSAIFNKLSCDANSENLGILEQLVKVLYNDTSGDLSKFSPSELAAWKEPGNSKDVSDAKAILTKMPSATSSLKKMLNENKLQETLLFMWKGMNKRVYNGITKAYEESSFLTKIDFMGFTEVGANYFAPTVAKWVICTVIVAMQDTNSYMNYVGDSAASVADTLKSANISGTIMMIAYVILMIIGFIYPSFLGYSS